MDMGRESRDALHGVVNWYRSCERPLELFFSADRKCFNFVTKDFRKAFGIDMGCE